MFPSPSRDARLRLVDDALHHLTQLVRQSEDHEVLAHAESLAAALLDLGSLLATDRQQLIPAPLSSYQSLRAARLALPGPGESELECEIARRLAACQAVAESQEPLEGPEF